MNGPYDACSFEQVIIVHQSFVIITNQIGYLGLTKHEQNQPPSVVGPIFLHSQALRCEDENVSGTLRHS